MTNECGGSQGSLRSSASPAVREIDWGQDVGGETVPRFHSAANETDANGWRTITDEVKDGRRVWVYVPPSPPTAKKRRRLPARQMTARWISPDDTVGTATGLQALSEEAKAQIGRAHV